mgnify:CR=1 FL=1
MPFDDLPEGTMGLLAGERAGDNASALSVSEISAALKRHVEQGFAHVRIRGEISGFKRAASGHLYLALKDEQAVIDAIMWKGSALRLAFQPQDGIEVIATGKLTTYPGRSKYQIVIETMEIVGEGALLALLGAAWRLVKLPRHWRRRAIALVVVAALGVGFLVHDVLKDSWGRPRPVATQAFGGAHPYQPALHPSDLCPRNCSFVSGHAAGGFMLLAVGMVGSRRTRWRWWAAGTAAGAVIGLARIAAGGHYLSDIVFGLLAVWGTAIVVREAWLRLAVWRRRRRLARAVA